MAYYEDLTPYNYHHFSEKELNVGWLQKGQPFSVGEVPEYFLHRLKYFKQKPFPLFYDGSHQCEFCNDTTAVGTCELRVVSKDDELYACPDLIIHYVEEHNYLPPQEFIDAVMNGPRPGQDKYIEVVYRHAPTFWQQRKPDINDENYEEKMRSLMIDNLTKEVDSKIMKEILEKNSDFKKFIDAYNKVMPAVYAVNTGDSEKK